MKTLVRVRMVQFFLFEQQEIQTAEITGVFGPNGSGKSSLLDAVQIAMLGADSNRVVFNAQADDGRRSRTLKDYCLGRYGQNAEDRVRDNATTYVTLIWHDTETGRPLSMGVCINAWADRDTHEVRGRYILPDVELSMGDHLELMGGEYSPRQWETFRHALIERARVSGEDPVYPDATRYIRAMLLALRGSGNAPTTDAFIRAFRFALRMRFNTSVDQIVRNDVLEARPTNIKKFKEVTESFRHLTEMVKRVEAQILDGQKVEVQFNRAAEESSRAVTWAAAGKASEVGARTDVCDQASGARTKADDELDALQTQQTTLQADLSAAKAEAQRARAQREAHKAHKNYGELLEAIKLSEKQARNEADSLARDLSFLAGLLQRAAAFPTLAEESTALAGAAAAVTALIRNPELRTKEEFETVVRPAAKLAEQAFSSLFLSGGELNRELQDARAKLKQALADLDRVKRGLRTLDPDVQQLQQELRDQGIEAVAVCDLVEVTDPAWQGVIEAYLGRNVQALLVSGPQEHEAFRIYRTQRGIYGVKLALESRQANIRTPDSGTVAELIRGANPAAVNYLRRQFGDIRRAQSDGEALAGARTLTQDGMLVSQSDVDRLKPVSEANLRIGAGGAGQSDAVRKTAERAQTRVSQLEATERELQKLVAVFRPVASHESVMSNLLQNLEGMRAAQRDSLAKAELMKEAADDEYVRLGEVELEWEGKVAHMEPLGQELAERVGSARRNVQECEERLARAREAVNLASTQADASRNHPEYNAEFYLKQWDSLLEQFQSRYPEMARHCEEQRLSCERRCTNASGGGMKDLGTFLSTYHEQMSPETGADWRRARAWLAELIDRLTATQLVPYKEEMEAAYRTSQETFRNDVALALSQNLDWLEETMNRLNEVLRNCPTFSNGERYRFRRVARPALDTLLRFIKDVAAYGATEDLLGTSGEMPEEFRQLLEDKVATGAAGVVSPLDDYREFFEFDIEILREDSTTGHAKVIGQLSKRLGPGSGGEHRAPLYVIAGAALASAYRLDHGNGDGLRLVLLDEAFYNMDAGNMNATMRYLEQLGLQVFMASPGENLATLTAFLHRYYDILRDPTNNTIRLSAHDVSQEIRELFQSDSPDIHPELIGEELAAMKLEAIALAPNVVPSGGPAAAGAA